MKINMQSLQTKLIAMCLLVLLFPIFSIGIGEFQTSKSQLDEAGNITLEEAQEKVRVAFLGEKDAKGTRPIKKEYTVGETGYLWAVNQERVSVMNPSNEGNDLTNVVTEDGVHLTARFDGGG